MFLVVSKLQVFNGKKFDFVIIYYSSRFTWILFIKQKGNSFEANQIFQKGVQYEEKSVYVIYLRSDHGKEFESSSFNTLFDENDIFHKKNCFQEHFQTK